MDEVIGPASGSVLPRCSHTFDHPFVGSMRETACQLLLLLLLLSCALDLHSQKHRGHTERGRRVRARVGGSGGRASGCAHARGFAACASTTPKKLQVHLGDSQAKQEALIGARQQHYGACAGLGGPRK